MESQETLKLYFVTLLQVLGRKKICHFYKLEFLLAHVFSFVMILKCGTYHGNVCIFWMAYIKKIEFLYSHCNFMSKGRILLIIYVGLVFHSHLYSSLSIALWLFKIVIQLTIAKNKIQVLCTSADRAIQISWFSVH